jgi:hypothetical protein
MGLSVPANKRVRTRTARPAGDDTGKFYVLKAGAPKHYISGFGVVGAGDVVSLPADVEPGDWLVEINKADVAKVQADPGMADVLAQKAAERAAAEAGEAGEEPAKEEPLSEAQEVALASAEEAAKAAEKEAADKAGPKTASQQAASSKPAAK